MIGVEVARAQRLRRGLDHPHADHGVADGVIDRAFTASADFHASSLEQKQSPPAYYPLLRPEDEEEVERMFQRLKSVGRLDPRKTDET